MGGGIGVGRGCQRLRGGGGRGQGEGGRAGEEKRGRAVTLRSREFPLWSLYKTE